MKWNGEDYWAMSYKLSHGFIRMGHNVFDFGDRAVADSFMMGMRQLGRPYVNKKLRAVCDVVRPDLLVLGHCNLIQADTIRLLKEKFPGMRIAHWNCDALFVERNVDRLREVSDHIDATFVTTGGKDLEQLASGKSSKFSFMPNPVDRSIETGKSFERTNHTHDLFLATSRGLEKERISKTIQSSLPDVRFALRGILGMPEVRGAEMMTLMNDSKMGLNISQRNDVFHYSSDRMSLLMGNGLLTFTHRGARFEDFFSDNELAYFDSDEELLDKIKWFHSHDLERKKTAQNGWTRVHELFDSALVAQWIVDATFDQPHSFSYGWPTKIHGGQV